MVVEHQPTACGLPTTHYPLPTTHHPLSMSLLLVLTTLDLDTDAAPLAQALVEERLAACVKVLPPMLSIYRWKGAVEQAREQQLIIKTSADRLDALKARLAELHPYEVPEVVVIDADGAASYEAWLAEAVRPT